MMIRLKIIVLSKFNKKKRKIHIKEMENDLEYINLESSSLAIKRFQIGNCVQTNKKYYKTFDHHKIKGIIDSYIYTEYAGRPNTFHYIYKIKLNGDEYITLDESWLELCN